MTWLASWTENIQHTLKYIMLNPSSKLKVGGMLLVRQSWCLVDNWLLVRGKRRCGCHVAKNILFHPKKG